MFVCTFIFIEKNVAHKSRQYLYTKIVKQYWKCNHKFLKMIVSNTHDFLFGKFYTYSLSKHSKRPVNKEYIYMKLGALFQILLSCVSKCSIDFK